MFIYFLLISLFSIPSFSFQNFSFNSSTFLLDGQPFTIRSGEMHFARIPPEYWRHRLQLAKAMGMNTIATYIFWNFHEFIEGQFDFSTQTHDLAKFLRTAQEEGLFVLLRPGPYTCAEWDYGGLPYWLLKQEGIKVRSYDQKYLSYAEKYIKRLSEIIVPLQITHGGPIVMVQIENEFGSYGNDRPYIEFLHKLWKEVGIEVPFYSADGAWTEALQSGHISGGAIGLDPGVNEDAFKVASNFDPTVVSFSSETYPGWLTHWGENWAGKSIEQSCEEIKFLLNYGKSFNLYMIHGGTNFGFWAGANDGDKGYQPDITSYDYDAPISENGNATMKYFALRNLIQNYINESLPAPPEPIESMTIDKIGLEIFTTIWDQKTIFHYADFPKFMEYFDQFSGLMIYRTILRENTSGVLEIKGLKDYALVFIDDVFVGLLSRKDAVFSLIIPNNSKKEAKLEILVEGMGRINFGWQMVDRKGINGNVTLDGSPLIGWQMSSLPFDETFIESIKEKDHNGQPNKQGIIFKGEFYLKKRADTFFDVSEWEKGILFVNGKNLGRYWNIGPQYRLYCPASYLFEGRNEILIFDFHMMSASFVTGEKTLKK